MKTEDSTYIVDNLFGRQYWRKGLNRITAEKETEVAENNRLQDMIDKTSVAELREKLTRAEQTIRFRTAANTVLDETVEGIDDLARFVRMLNTISSFEIDPQFILALIVKTKRAGTEQHFLFVHPPAMYSYTPQVHIFNTGEVIFSDGKNRHYYYPNIQECLYEQQDLFVAASAWESWTSKYNYEMWLIGRFCGSH